MRTRLAFLGGAAMLAPAPAHTAYYTPMSVTGYSWGCGASGPVAQPHVGYPRVGMAASTLAFGTTVGVPGWGTVVVRDRGVGYGQLDIFMSSCRQAVAFGRRWLRVRISR